MTCRQVKDKHNITWQETLGEAEDLQPCPETETTIVLPGTLIRVGGGETLRNVTRWYL